MTSKSELKRRASTDPFWAAERIYELEEQIEIAVEALEYYEHPAHYEETVTLGGTRQPGVLTEGGHKARTTLAKIRGEK